MVTNIQRMATQDGPGIRTVVFLKGCTLRCPWCANPENIHPQKQYWFRDEICNAYYGKSENCKICTKSQIAGKVCHPPYIICPFGAIGIYGKEYSAETLVQELLKDVTYWKQGGGVTFSGGEPLIQEKELKPAIKLLKEQNVHITFETAFHIPIKVLESIIDLTDLFIVDLKILDSKQCKDILNGDVSLFLENVRYTSTMGKDIIFRIPASDKFTLSDSNAELILNLISRYNYPVEILTLHNLGENKYRSLCIKPPIDYMMNPKSLEVFIKRAVENGGKVEVKKI